MSHAAAYLRRAGGGAVITSATLVHARGGAQWSAPARLGSAEHAAEATRSCAQWLIRELANVPGTPELSLVLDLDGARCGWFTAPSAEEPIVRAAVAAARLEAQAGGEAHNPLGWMGDHEMESDVSAQPLSAPRPGRGGGRKKKDAESTAPQRVALLSTADLGVRSLLDELDRSGVTPARVVSLWHVLGEAWQDQAPAGGNGNGHGKGAVLTRSTGAPVALAASSAVASTIVIDDLGRLAWAWSNPAGLICCGSMLLRRSVSDDTGSASAPLNDESAGETPAPDADRAQPSVIEVSRSDCGRLAAEWLAWGAQLGVAPSRVVCVGPENLVCTGLDDDLPHAPATNALAQTLGRMWPGTDLAAHVEPDPLSATLRRSVIAGNDLGLPGARRDNSGEATDPRVGLLDLSRRPGRASRRVYAWNFVMLVAAAAAVAVLGYKLQVAAEDLEAQRAAKAASTKDLLAEVKDVSPRASSDPEPKIPLQNTIRELIDTRKRVTFERPVLHELGRVLNVISHMEAGKLELRSLTIGTRELPQLNIAMENADAGTTFTTLMEATGSPVPWVRWFGGRVRPVMGTDNRLPNEFNIGGTWEDAPKVIPGSAQVKKPAPGTPATAPASAPPVAPAVATPTAPAAPAEGSTPPAAAPLEMPAPNAPNAPTPAPVPAPEPSRPAGAP